MTGIDPYLHDLDRKPRPRAPRGPVMPSLFDAVYEDSPESSEPVKVAPVRESEPWKFMGDAPDEPVFHELVRIAREMAERRHGVILGEVIYEYERSGRRVGGVPMEDKTKEQRQTSWLPKVMRAAGLKATKSYRPSPVERHHSSPHRVWVLPAVAAEAAA